MKKGKLSIRAVVSIVLTAILFCMPAIGFSLNQNNTVHVFAEENEKDTVSEKSAESTTEETTEGETVSGNEVQPECSCEDKCTRYEFDSKCEVCKEDYSACAYKKPNVTIAINQPEGWYNDKAVVHFTVKDAAYTGNFEVAKILAKVGQNGSWTDITEDKKLEISENCTVYVQVTDQKGNTYERSRNIKCFDTSKPTLNAAISDRLLTVQVHDNDSGAKVIYINGYEFTNLTNGTLNVRLQQFDAGYEYFTISAMDHAGNMSEVYKTKNPYYKDPADTSDDNPAEQLPSSAEPTKPGSATGVVTEHTKTDSNGNAINTNSSQNLSPAEQKKKAMAEADAAEKGENNTDKERGKEFYTIQTASDKVFYLIVDRDGEEEMVYFLTEVTENDLLNTTSQNSETLPKNSAALESAIPTTETALPNNNSEIAEETQTEDVESIEESTQSQEPEEVKKEANPMISYVLMGVLAVGFISGAYYFKVVKKKKEDFVDDEEDEEELEEYENEDEDTEDSDDDFFADEEEN